MEKWDSATTVGRELVEERLDNGGPGKVDRFQQVFFYDLHVAYFGAVTAKQLHNQMFAQSFHSCDPLS